jgi:hypothetical protein
MNVQKIMVAVLQDALMYQEVMLVLVSKTTFGHQKISHAYQEMFTSVVSQNVTMVDSVSVKAPASVLRTGQVIAVN